MNKAIAIIAILLLAGCERHPPLASTCATNTRLVLNIRVASAEEIAASHPQKFGDTLSGFTGVLPNGEAVIVIPPFRYQDDTETLKTWGHELAHIVCGKWHA